MKKILLIAIIVLGLLNVNAQNKGDFELGGNAGVSFSNISIILNGFNYSTNFTTGISGEYYFSDRWGVKAKLIYDPKGWGNGFIDEFFFEDVTVNDFTLHYITMPIMANLHFGSERNWYINLGMYMGFLVDAKAYINDVDISNPIDKIEFGVAAGIGYKFSVSERTKLFFEIDTQHETSGIGKERLAINFGVLFTL